MNLFGITSIIIFFASLGFGLFLYSSNRESRINRSWFIVSIFVALWGLSLYGVTSASDSNTALNWQYLLDISAILIPVTYLSFVCDLLGLKDYWFRRLTLYIGAIIAIFSVTDFFKTGVSSVKYGFYWINPGPYYLVFPLFFIGVTFIALVFLLIGYRKNPDKLFRAQIRNTLLAGVIGFGGGITNFFPQVINVYPFGNYFVLLYVFFMSYGVLKYKLLSKKIISAQLFGGAIVLVFLFNLLQPTSFIDWGVKFIMFSLILFFAIFLVRGVFKEVQQREKIEKLAQDLKEANQGQVNLMHFMNHQIKGRLGNAKNIFAELLTDDYGAMPDSVKPMLKKGLEESNLGVEYVQNILKGASAENGTLPFDMKEMDLKNVVEEEFNKLKDRASSKNLDFKLNIDNGDYKTKGDSVELGEAIKNLIDNSLNYTEKGSIRINLVSHGNGFIIKIEDTGIGITREDMSKLFKSGGRGADSLKVNTNSTGYGLAFVKGVIEAHKGKVYAESDGKGKGSVFTIELPKT
jgi:signal transduction histidine kinase